MTRALILAATFATLFCLWMERSTPVKSVQTDYCLNDVRIARRHPETGEWQYGWGKGYGPCSEHDAFENI